LSLKSFYENRRIKKQEVLILGFGLEGKDTFLFLKKKFPQKDIYIADAKELKDFDLKTRKLLEKPI